MLQTIPYEGDYMRTSDMNPEPTTTSLPDTIHPNRGVLLVPLPFFHIYGLCAGLFMPLMMRAKGIFMPAFDMMQFLTIIQEHKVLATCYLYVYLYV
jgi:acyl-CoA synthetase (AMP-forming)/AMP-acid ligase II